MWPIHFIAVLPVPTVSSMSHAAHMFPGSHLHVDLAFDGIALPSGMRCSPVPVELATSGLMAACSGPGLGGVISGAALAPDGVAALPDGAGAAVLPEGACAKAIPAVQIETAMSSLFMVFPSN